MNFVKESLLRAMYICNTTSESKYNSIEKAATLAAVSDAFVPSLSLITHIDMLGYACLVNAPYRVESSHIFFGIPANLVVLKTPILLHARTRHGTHSAFWCQTPLDATLSILLLLHSRVVFAHIRGMGCPARTMANGHAYTDLEERQQIS